MELLKGKKLLYAILLAIFVAFFSSAAAFASTGLNLIKTVTTPEGTCPGLSELTVPEKTEVKYCFDVTNDTDAFIENIALNDPALGGDLTSLLDGLTNGGLYPGDTATAEILYTVPDVHSVLPFTIINTATVTGTVDGCNYEDSSAATVYVVGIELIKDISISSTPDGPWGDGPIYVLAGTTIYWRIRVRNISPIPVYLNLTDLLYDEYGGYIIIDLGNSCTVPGELAAFDPDKNLDYFECIIQDTAIAGLHINTITAEACAKSYPDVCDIKDDSASYFGIAPGIDIEKLTNGEDADAAPGPYIKAGTLVNWDYTVTNTGNVPLDNVTVTDSQGVLISCPKTILDPGESFNCTASGIATEGQYENIGSAIGYYGQIMVKDNDYSHYFGFIEQVNPEITIDKQISKDCVNWFDSLTVSEGSEIWYRFIIKNTGDVPLSQISLTDTQYQSFIDANPAGCTPPLILQAGEVWETCVIGPVTAIFTGDGEPFVNTATVTGCYEGTCVTDEDTASYSNLYWAFTPGFWKNHYPGCPSGHDAWQYTAFKTGDLLSEVFDIPSCNGNLDAFFGATLLEALGFQGGSGVSGAAEILLRAAVASLLNASYHETRNGGSSAVYFPYDSNGIIDMVNAALDSCDRETMLDLADYLDMINNGIDDIVWENNESEPKPKPKPDKGPKKESKGSSIGEIYLFEPDIGNPWLVKDTGISGMGNTFNIINGLSSTLAPSWQKTNFEYTLFYQNGFTWLINSMNGPWWWQASMGETSVGPLWYNQYQNSILGPAWYYDSIFGGGPWWAR